MLIFECPLSDRMRNFIRIEQLFNRFDETLASDDQWQHHVAICTLFEIIECSSRAELKRDMLHELERQRLHQLSLPEPNQERLGKLNLAIQELQIVNTQTSQALRENEWLSAFQQRLKKAGSTTAVELPSYYFWQQQTAQQRRDYLKKWSKSIQPFYHATRLLGDILRSKPDATECEAISGSHQLRGLNLQTQLVCIEVDEKYGVVPEISANKYATQINFLQADQEKARSTIANKNIPFKLILCTFEEPIKG